MLQWILLLIGLVIIVAVYIFTRYQNYTRNEQAFDEHNIDVDILDKKSASDFDSDKLLPSPEIESQQEQKILVLNICAQANQEWSGDKILKCALAAGLKCSDKNIFEYYIRPPQVEATAVFYVANFVNPGTFDWNNMTEFKTRGMSLFMRLPTVHSARDSLDKMLDCGQQMSEALGADLCNDKRQPLSKQAVKDMYLICKNYDDV